MTSTFDIRSSTCYLTSLRSVSDSGRAIPRLGQPRITILDSDAIRSIGASWVDGHDGYVAHLPWYTFSECDSDEEFAIPAYLDSADTLILSGFEPHIARQITEAYKYNPGRGLSSSSEYETIIEFTQGLIRTAADITDAYDAKHDWDYLLTKWGICADLRARMLDPRFDNIRLRATASEWIIDTLQLMYEFLIALKDQIAYIREYKGKKGKRPPIIGRTPHIATQWEPTVKQGDIRVLPQVITPLLDDLLKGTADISTLPQDPDTNQAIEFARVMPQSTILYKGCTRARLMQAIKDKGTIDLDPLFSRPPTDFHRTSETTLYFTTHLEIAIQYAEWAVARARPEGAAVLQLAHHKDLTTNIRPIDDDVWRDMIWYCRGPNSKRAKPPSSIRHTMKEKLLIGSLCGDSNGKVKRLKDKKEIKTWKLSDGKIGTQHVFMDWRYFVKDIDKAVWVVSTIHTGEPDTVIRTGMKIQHMEDSDEMELDDEDEMY